MAAEVELGPVELAILAAMDELLRDLESSSRRLESWIPKLQSLDEPEPATKRQATARAWPVAEDVDAAPNDVRIEVAKASVDDLLDFQEQLSQISGVSNIVIEGLCEGGVSLLVQLESKNGDFDGEESLLESQPRVVCVLCGKVISEGTAEVSHGLCPGCTRAFLKGETPR